MSKKTRNTNPAALTGLHSQAVSPTEEELAALRRLIIIARRDTGQSKCVADFLLSWWNARACGGFDLTSLWGLDDTIAADMVVVFAVVARCHEYPPTLDLDFDSDFKAIVEAWRPKMA